MRMQKRITSFRVENTGSLFQLICAMGSNGDSHRSISAKISDLLGRKIDTYSMRSEDFVTLLNEIKKARGNL